MSKQKGIDYFKERKYVSKLYISVLTERMNVRDALMNFPKDCNDKTIIAAWHALCHYEADEDLRKKDKLYKKEQDEYIEFIAFTLDKGDALPQNVINSYIPYYTNALIPPDNKTIKGIINQFKKFLC